MKKLCLIIIILNLLSVSALADDAIAPSKMQKCENALNACIEYAADLSDENSILNAEIVELKKQRDEALNQAAGGVTPAFISIVPTWAWIVGGAVLGGLIVNELKR